MLKGCTLHVREMISSHSVLWRKNLGNQVCGENSAPSKVRKYESHLNLFPASNYSFICGKIFSPKSKQTFYLRNALFAGAVPV